MTSDILEARLGLTFHRTFPLSTPAIAEVLAVAARSGDQLTATMLRDKTSLGTIYVEAMPRYARGSGLMEMGSYRLTDLGKVVVRNDGHLFNPLTLWLMHYHMSTPKGPGPAFWSYLVTHALPVGETIPSAALTSAVAHFVEAQAGSVSLQDRTIRGTSTAFRGTYTKSDALGKLGLLTAAGRDTIAVSSPQSPPVGAVAYALADYWEAHYGDQATVSLNELARQDGFARVMWMDSRRLESVLEDLRREGLVDLFRIAPPFQVARLWEKKSDLLERLYR